MTVYRWLAASVKRLEDAQKQLSIFDYMGAAE